jgi:hypothetical protein
MQSRLGPFFPDGNQNYWKSTMQRELSNEAISAIVEHANSASSPLSFLVLEYYGGAAARVQKDATAFPHRDLPWDILFVAQWTKPEEMAIHRDWARSGEEILRPFLLERTSRLRARRRSRRGDQHSFRPEPPSLGCHQTEIRSHEFFPRELQHQAGPDGTYHGMKYRVI